MDVSTMFGTEKKTIWHLSLYRSPRSKFLWPFESKYEYCIFLYELFLFYEKLPSPLDHADFFRNILPHHTPSNPNNIFYGFLLVDNRTMQIKFTAALLKKSEIYYKDLRDSSTDIFLRVTKGIKCLRQNTLDRLRF